MADATGPLVAAAEPPERPEVRIELEMAAEPACVGRVRTAVRRFAAAHGAGPELVADLCLAVSEAATNALVHAYVGRDPGRIRVTARAGVDELIVNVADDGRGMQPRTDSPGMGIGLPTIGQLTSGLDIRDRPGGGTDVRMTFAAPGVRGAAAAEPMAEEEHTRLLAEAARLAEGAGWPAKGLAALVDLLVPAVADACAIDVVDDDAGVARRLAARVDGEPELSRRLARREPDATPPPPDLLPRVADLTAPDVVGVDGEELADLRAAELCWWVGLPLADGRRPLGVLHLGMRAERGRPAEQDLSFFALLAERAGAGLAGTRLVEQLRRTRRRLERILGALAEAVTVNDAAGRTVYANEAAARLLGARDVDEVLAARPGDLAARFIITREDGSPVAVDDLPGARLLAGAEAPQLLTRSVHRASGVERWLLTKARLLDDDEPLAVNIIEDVTEAKNAERRQRFLARASDLLVAAGGEATLQRLAELLVEELADWCVVDLVDPSGGVRRVALAHSDPTKINLALDIQRRYPAPEAPRGALEALLAGGRPVLVGELTEEMLSTHARDAEHLRILREVGLRSVMIVPLRDGERTLGAITLMSADSARAFAADDLAFATDVARRAGAAVAATTQGSLADRLAALGVSGLLETVVEHLPVAVIVAEAPSGRLLLDNRLVERIWRRPFRATMTGGDHRYRGFREDGTQLAPEDWPLSRSIAHGEVVRDELIEIERGDGERGIIAADSVPIRGRDGSIVAAVTVFADVTERELNERALALLAETGSLLEEPLRIEQRLRHVASMCVPALGDMCGVYLVRGDGSLTRRLAAADPEVERVMGGAMRATLDPEGDFPVARVIRSGEPEVLWDVPEQTLRSLARDAESAAALAGFAPMSSLVLPMNGRSGTVGALGVFSVRRRRRFDDVELQAGLELARRCALALENAELYTHQRHLAETLQTSLLPERLPAVPGAELAACYLPAGTEAAVGGDFYDVFLGDAGWTFVIGDVCGSGPAAAALTALTRAAVRVGTLRDPDPIRVLALVNDALRQEGGEQSLCTAIAGIAVPRDGGLDVSLATGGHPLPLLLGRGAPTPVEVRGTMLGAVEDPQLGSARVTLAPGETLLLHTDGVLDAIAASGEGRLGEDGLLRLVGELEHAPGPLVAGLERVLTGDGFRRADDVAVLALRAAG